LKFAIDNAAPTSGDNLNGSFTLSNMQERNDTVR
jgi:hypothetical protein